MLSHRRPQKKWQRGYTLIDFFSALVIVTAVLTTFFSLIGIKSELLEDVENRTLAQNAVAQQIETLKTNGLPKDLSSKKTFTIPHQWSSQQVTNKDDLTGEVSFVRKSPHLVQVLVTITWKTRDGDSREEWALTYVEEGK